jgi:hypothetical protein
MAEAVVEHHPCSVVERHVRRRRDRVRRHPLPDTRLARVHPRRHRAKHVALAEDPDEATEVLHDDCADVPLAHPLRDLAEGVLGRDREEVRRDDLGKRAH